MPFFCLQLRRYHGLLSFPLERYMAARVILTLYARHTEEFWNTALGEAGFSLGWRTGHRIWPYSLLSTTKREDVSLPMATRVRAMLLSGELGSQPEMAACAHTVSHRGKKLILGDTGAIYRKGFSTSCTHTQTFPLSLFCSKLFFLTCICILVFLRQKQERVGMRDTMNMSINHFSS